MPESEGNGDVKVVLIVPLKHEEWPVQGVGPELSISSTEVHFVKEASWSIFQDLRA